MQVANKASEKNFVNTFHLTWRATIGAKNDWKKNRIMQKKKYFSHGWNKVTNIKYYALSHYTPYKRNCILFTWNWTTIIHIIPDQSQKYGKRSRTSISCQGNFLMSFHIFISLWSTNIFSISTALQFEFFNQGSDLIIGFYKSFSGSAVNCRQTHCGNENYIIHIITSQANARV